MLNGIRLDIWTFLIRIVIFIVIIAIHLYFNVQEADRSHLGKQNYSCYVVKFDLIGFVKNIT